MTSTGLVLECSLAISSAGILENDLVRIVLRNNGSAPVVVAGRLAVGYDTSTDRELYLVITRHGTSKVVGQRTQLYHRAPHPPDDVKTLQPGQMLQERFALGDWYSCPDGALDIQAVYDPTGAVAIDPEIARDVITSARVRVIVGRDR